MANPALDGPIPKPTKKVRTPRRLQPGKPPERRTPLKLRNEERAAKREEIQFGEKARWIRSLWCSTCGRVAPSQASHLRTCGAGGRSEDLAPQCAWCHFVGFHDMGRDSFALHIHAELLAFPAFYEAWWRIKDERGRTVSFYVLTTSFPQVEIPVGLRVRTIYGKIYIPRPMQLIDSNGRAPRAPGARLGARSPEVS